MLLVQTQAQAQMATLTQALVTHPLRTEHTTRHRHHHRDWVHQEALRTRFHRACTLTSRGHTQEAPKCTMLTALKPAQVAPVVRSLQVVTLLRLMSTTLCVVDNC